MLSIDNQEGVVKLDQTGDVKMLQLKYLLGRTKYAYLYLGKWIKEFIPGRLPSPEYQSPPAKKSRVSDLFADFEDPQPGTSSASPLKDNEPETF